MVAWAPKALTLWASVHEAFTECGFRSWGYTVYQVVLAGLLATGAHEADSLCFPDHTEVQQVLNSCDPTIS